MDLSIIQAINPDVAGMLNVDPATLLLYIGIICTGCNIVGRLIPDDKTGPLGVVRDVCKVLGVYAPNRVATGVTVNDVARSIIAEAKPEVIELAEQADTLIPEVLDSKPVVPAFPGLARDPETGKFVKREKGESI